MVNSQVLLLRSFIWYCITCCYGTSCVMLFNFLYVLIMFPSLDCKFIHLSLLSVHNYLASTVYKAPQLVLEEYKEAKHMVLYSNSKDLRSSSRARLCVCAPTHTRHTQKYHKTTALIHSRASVSDIERIWMLLFSPWTYCFEKQQALNTYLLSSRLHKVCLFLFKYVYVIFYWESGRGRPVIMKASMIL